jgi:hypothetical protein
VQAVEHLLVVERMLAGKLGADPLDPAACDRFASVAEETGQ